MATKPVTLTPSSYSGVTIQGSSYVFREWRTYSGEQLKFKYPQYYAFRFEVRREATLSNIRVSYTITGGDNIYGSIKILSTYSTIITITDGSTIKSYEGRNTVQETASYSNNIYLADDDYIYIIIYSNSQSNYVQSLSISATMEADIPELKITGISPNPATASKNVTFSFGNRLGHDLTLELTSGDISIATYNYIDEDEFTVIAESEWLSSKTETEITAKATDSTDELFTREATAKFKIKADPIGVELTATPTYSGPNSNITVTFNNRKGHAIYLTVQGAAKGSTNKITLVSRTNITSEISDEKYYIVAADSWFTSINGNEMTVYLKFEDAVETREETPSFVLKAGDGTKPVFKSVELSSHIYPEQYASVLSNAGYNGFVVGYSQVKIKAKVKSMAGVQMSGAVARFNSYDTTLTYTGPDPDDSAYLVYEGTTTRTISSTSTATITVTATDARSRSSAREAYVYSSSIQQLPSISLRQSTVPTVGSKLIIDPKGYVGSYKCKIRTNNLPIYPLYYDDLSWTAAFEGDTSYSQAFTSTEQTGKAYINLQVYITDALDRSISGGYVTFRLNAPNPEFLSFTYENVPDPRMPETDKSGNPYGVVSGFSRIKLKATVRWYYDESTVTVSGSYGAVGGAMTEGEGRDNDYGHKDIDYTFIPESVVSTTSASIEYTPTAEDTGKDSYRTGKTVGSKLSIPITRLANITVSATPSGSVNAGTTITVTPSNVVGDYTYVFATTTKTELAKSDEPISDATFTQECSSDWFATAGVESGNLSVELIVTDVLGRTSQQPYRFTVRLENLTLQVTPTDLVFGYPVSISIGGTAGQIITVAFTTPNLDGTTKELYSFTTTSPTPDPVTCPKSWFTGFPNNNHLDITVTASYGSGTDKKEKSVPIKLNYPALGLAITKTVDSQEVAVTSATVGENLNYTFSNLEGESVNIDYVYPAQNNRQLLQYGPYSAAQTIATPQLFDMANPPVTKSLSMQVNIVISDVRGRTATVSNFTINASESMRPGVYDSEFEPINPPTVDSAFATDFIGNVSRLNATIKASSGSMAKVTEAILSIDGANVTMTPNGVDSSGKYVFTYVGNSPLQVDAIYDPRQVNLTVGYGLNSGGKVVENPQRAATVYPISIRKNNTYTVYYSGQYTAQCALWSGDTFDRIVTNSQYSPYEVSFDTGNCDKVYVSLMRKNETSETDPVDVEEANLKIRMIDPFDMYAQLTPISFNVTLKDERGLSVTAFVGTVFAYPYNAPNASIGYHRCNQDGTPNDSGGNCLLTCDFSFEGLWLNAFPPSPQNRGYVTVSTSNYDETKQFDFTKWKKAQFTLVAGYGLNDSGEVVSNPLRAATTTPYIVTEGGSPGGPATHAAYKVTFDGDYIVEYARWEESTLIWQGTINSSGQYITAEVGESLYISLKRSNETSESSPVDIAEANVQLTLNLGDSEDGSFEFLIPNMSIEQTYQITITLTDLITSTVYTVTLSTGYAIMDFYRGGKGVAIGKVAEHSTMLEVNPNWELKASVKINGQLYDLATLLSQIKQQLGI